MNYIVFFKVKKIVIVCEGGKLELCCLDGKISIYEVVFGRIEGGNVCFYF